MLLFKNAHAGLDRWLTGFLQGGNTGANPSMARGFCLEWRVVGPRERERWDHWCNPWREWRREGKSQTRLRRAFLQLKQNPLCFYAIVLPRLWVRLCAFAFPAPNPGERRRCSMPISVGPGDHMGRSHRVTRTLSAQPTPYGEVPPSRPHFVSTTDTMLTCAIPSAGLLSLCNSVTLSLQSLCQWRCLWTIYTSVAVSSLLAQCEV